MLVGRAGDTGGTRHVTHRQTGVVVARDSFAGVMPPLGLDVLVDTLREAGWTVIGPQVRDGAVVLDEIVLASELPRGIRDHQEAGSYRLEDRGDDVVFGCTVGPDSAKRFLFPSRHLVWSAERDSTEDTWHFEVAPEPDTRIALLGVRACDLAAISIQDRVFLRDDHTDRTYALRRDDVLLVGVQCGRAGATCFCASMGTGPGIDHGADLVLTELLEPHHEFLVEPRTERGHEVAATLPLHEATDEHHDRAEAIVAATAASMGRQLDTDGLPDVLASSLASALWDEVAQQCLTCANCTLVCPTCFCTDVTDVVDVSGDTIDRWRSWDSCFTLGFSHTADGSMRTTTSSRYRQWMTHKLGTWVEQFGTSGCVGCGRCITWCPVGIDLVEVATAFTVAAQSDSSGAVR